MILRKKQVTMAFLMVTLFLGAFSTMYNAQGAAATGASLELSSDSYLVDSLVTIRVYNVIAAGASFNVYFSYDSSGTDTLEAKSEYANITVVLGSNEDEWVHTMKFPAPTAGSYVGVHVCESATGATTDLAADYCYKQTFSELWPSDLIIEIGISLMVVLLIVAIVIGIAKIGSGRL